MIPDDLPPALTDSELIDHTVIVCLTAAALGLVGLLFAVVLL